jgi:hypothetical protein
MRGVRLENALDVRIVEPRVSDERIGHAVLIGDRVQPTRLSHLIVAIPFGFHVHGGHHVVVCCVASIVGRQVVALQTLVWAEEEVLVGAIAQPGVVVAIQIPQMMVRIDDRNVLEKAVHRADRQSWRALKFILAHPMQSKKRVVLRTTLSTPARRVNGVANSTVMSRQSGHHRGPLSNALEVRHDAGTPKAGAVAGARRGAACTGWVRR